MRKILIFFSALLFSTFVSAEVSVLQGVQPEKKKAQAIYETPENLAIDDEILPATTDYYLLQACAVGKRPILTQVAEQEKPPQRGGAAKTATKPVAGSYKIKRYEPVSKCYEREVANTELEKGRFMQDARYALRDIPNMGPITVRTKAYLGNPKAAFIVADKALMPYTLPYDQMPKGSVLKKILTDQAKIAKFYSFNLPASRNLGLIMQRRWDRYLPKRISFYEEMRGDGLSKIFIVFVFSEVEKYPYALAPLEKSSDKIYDIVPDQAVQYLK